MTASTTTARPLTLDDIPAIVDLLAEVEADGPTNDHVGPTDLEELFTGPMVDLPTGSRGLFDGDRLVGFQVVVVVSDDRQWAAYLDGAVRPDSVDRGYGTALLTWAEQVARELKERQVPGRSGELRVEVPATRPRSAALAADLGFESWRHFFTMQRDLTQPVAEVPVPDGFVVRAYRDTDGEAVRRVRNASFADHWGSLESSPERWQANMIGSAAFRPAHSFLACYDGGERDGQIASFVMAEEFDHETKVKGFRTAYIALVGTVREARGLGLAGALLATQLQSMKDDGYRVAELGVDSDSPTGAGRIYERSGFAIIHHTEVAGKHI